MSARKHAADFVVVRRDPQTQRATEWASRCSCRFIATGETYETVEDEWRRHVHAETGSAPKPFGAQDGRWTP